MGYYSAIRTRNTINRSQVQIFGAESKTKLQQSAQKTRAASYYS